MRKVILGVAVSLDGYIEGPNGEYDWCFTDQDYGLTAFFQRVDAILMGRKSYEVANAAASVEGAAPNPWGDMTTYVFSNTLSSVQGKNTKLISGDANNAVRELKSTSGKDIWLFGGAELTASMLESKLVDEMWLSIHPVLLGSGKPLFPGIRERKNLKLISHQVYDTGLVSVCYKPA